MKLIFAYLKKYKLLILINFLAVFGFVATELGIPTVVADVIDEGIVRGDSPYIYRMGAVMVGLALFGIVGNVVLGYCSSRISANVTRDIREAVFAKAQVFSHAEYSKFGVASMINRTTNDVLQIQQFVNILLRMALLTPVMIAVSVFLTLRTSLELSFIMACSLPFIVAGVVVVAKYATPISRRQQQELDRLNRISRENLTGVRVVRAFCNEEYELNRFMETNEDYADAAKKMFKLMSSTYPAFNLVLNAAAVAVFWVAAGMIDREALQVGKLVAFLEYQFHTLFSIMMFSMVFVMYPRAAVSAGRISELLDTEPAVGEPSGGLTAVPAEGKVVFEDVAFRYRDGEFPVLEHISFSASKGETVAFIGSTGSGKSTVISLIPRFYDVTAGSIRIDGVDVRDYALDALREKIGFVPQKPVLFSGTIADNIRFGKENAGDEEVVHAAKVAQACDFIEEKEKKFDEPVSEGGTNLSGGQKQRLTIARAVVRRPEIYVFDDSFSALDFTTDAALRKALKEETGDSVVFIVAQRVSSIADADRIIVLDEGRIAGMGSHRQLLENCEIYQEIAASQLSEEELRNL